MNNFRRALRDASHHWPKLVLAWICSASVAALWSANIAALFPILEVTLRGEAPQQWNERRIAEATAQVTAVERDIAATEQTIATEKRPRERSLAELRLEELRLSEKHAQLNLQSSQRLTPWLDQYVPHDPFNVVLCIVAFMIGSMLIKQVLTVISSMIVAKVSNQLACDLRRRLFDKALVSDRASFMRIGQSGYIAQITATTDGLVAGINSVFGAGVSEPLKLVACLIGAAMISWRLMLMTAVFAPIGAFGIIFLNRRLRGLARNTLQKSIGFYHVLADSLTGLLTVQAYTMEEEERERFKKSTDDLMRFSLNANFYNSLVSPVTETIGVLMICMAIVVGAHMILRDGLNLFGVALFPKPLSVPALMVFFGMLLGASEPVRRMSGIIAGVNTGMVAADALYPLLDQQPLVMTVADPTLLPKPHSYIELDNVTFGYSAEHPVLRGVSLRIPFGEKLVVIGPNGGGKSTLVSLLCRFYDPQQGVIRMNDVPLTKMRLRGLRRRIGLVTQHTELFNESIYYNIRYGRWDATEAEVHEAARLARADEFIQRFPEKYRTPVGPNGLKLSGGQRQRIALARALLRDPEILILDEATSQVDVDSEKVIHEVLESFGRSRTLIIITHRESALRLADRVLRIDHGVAEIVPQRKIAA